MARVYSLWIFDRHCNPIYHQDWSHLHASSSSSGRGGPSSPGATSQTSGFASIGATLQRATSGAQVPTVEERPPPAQRPGIPSLPNVTRLGTPVSSSSAMPETNQSVGTRASVSSTIQSPGATSHRKPGSDLLPFDEEAKLVYGVVFSLRNMVRKLGGDSESFNSFTTPTYTLAHLHTPTMYTFVILTDPVPPPSSIPSRGKEGYSVGVNTPTLASRAGFGTGGGIPGTGGMSLKGVLLQIYRGPWVDNVSRNPLSKALEREERVVEPDADTDHVNITVTKDGRLDRLAGIDNDAFREGIERVLTQNKLSAPAS